MTTIYDSTKPLTTSDTFGRGVIPVRHIDAHGNRLPLAVVNEDDRAWAAAQNRDWHWSEPGLDARAADHAGLDLVCRGLPGC